MTLIQRQCCLYALCMIPGLWDLIDAWCGVTNGLKLCFHDFGHDAFRLLILTLCVTPLRHFGLKWAMPCRRPLGLACFTYALAHVSFYVGVGKKFDFVRIFNDFLTRSFLVFGLCTFIILCLLAFTSTSAAQKRMGRSWVKLHKLVYIAMILACIHYCLAFKVWHIQPFIESFLALIVMGVRFLF